jgi:hypothetical protein
MFNTKSKKYQACKKRVDAGVKFLDTKFTRAKWIKKIDHTQLEMQNASSCVCGQLFGNFWDIVLRWDDIGTPKISFKKSTALGFSESSAFSKNYDILQAVWLDKIIRLKKRAGLKV